MQKISPFLWFNGQAETAARFYVSVFRNAEMLDLPALKRAYGEGWE